MAARTPAPVVSGLWRQIKRHPTLVFLAVIVVLWQVAAARAPAHEFPGLGELAVALASLPSDGRYPPLEHIPLTLVRIALSVVLAMVIGVPLGIGMGVNERFEDYASVFVLLSLAVPALVWAFLAALWFGLTTYLVPVFTGVLILLPYVVINTWEGTKDVDPDLAEMAAAFEAGTLLRWRHLYLPHLTPYLLSTVRTVLAVGWKIMLVAEIFGTQSGLGYVINGYFRMQRNDLILAWSIPVMCVIFLAERLLKHLEDTQFDWRETDDIGQGARA